MLGSVVFEGCFIGFVQSVDYWVIGFRRLFLRILVHLKIAYNHNIRQLQPRLIGFLQILHNIILPILNRFLQCLKPHLNLLQMLKYLRLDKKYLRQQVLEFRIDHQMFNFVQFIERLLGNLAIEDLCLQHQQTDFQLRRGSVVLEPTCQVFEGFRGGQVFVGEICFRSFYAFFYDGLEELSELDEREGLGGLFQFGVHFWEEEGFGGA